MRVLILGAGGPAANGYVNSLRAADPGYYLIGADASRDNLEQAATDERHHLPDTLDALLALVAETEPDLVYAQPDTCVWLLSQHRNKVRALGPKVFLPRHQTIDVCRDKWRSYLAWRDCGVPVPRTWLVENEDDLAAAFAIGGPRWFRPAIGTGGMGSFSTASQAMADAILTERDVWGEYTCAEVLSCATMVWQAVFFHGELVCSQTRNRLAWTEGNRGSCRIGETFTDPGVDKIAHKALRAVDMFPHGIYGVDLCLNHQGVPMPTEINVGRFNTTIQFYSDAGLNMPHLYTQLAVGNDDGTRNLINPLPDGLRWIRMMDREPVLVTAQVPAHV